MRNGIAAAGNWIVDRVKIVDHWPEQDTLANILEERLGNGGGAFNVLVDLAKLGADFPLEGIGLVGNDQDGQWVLDRCKDHGIDSNQITSIDALTSHTDVMTIRESGRRTFFHQRGANALFSREHVDIERTHAKIFYLGYLLLLDQWDSVDAKFGTQAARLLADVSATGMKTAIDVVSEASDRFGQVVQPALPHVDWCFMNEFEVEKTTGKRDFEEAGVELLKLGVHECAFLHSPGGAMAISSDGERIWQPSVAIPKEKIAGCVGAGDAFAAGVLLGLHEEKSLAECLRMGVCVAAASLTEPSASYGILKLESCLELGRTYGYLKQ